MPARRLTLGSTIYLSNPEAGVFIGLPNNATSNDLETLQGVPSGGVITQDQADRMSATAATVRKQLIATLLATPITPIEGTEPETVETAAARIRRFERQYRIDNAITPY